MRQYIDLLQDNSGNAITNGSVVVRTYPAGTLAAIYSDNGLTPIAGSSVATDSTGAFSFFAADGDYTLQLFQNGLLYKTQSPVSIFDGAAQLTYTDIGAVNAYAIADSALEKALRTGLRASIKIGATNTAASTFQYNTLTAKAITLPGAVAVPAGALAAGGIYRLEYDGTSWQLPNSTLAQAAIGGVLFPRSPAESTASVTPTNFAMPNDPAVGTIQLARLGNYHGDGVTNDSAAYVAAVAIAEAISGASKVEGGIIVIPDGTTFSTSRIRIGSWVQLHGMGPFPTRINFADAVTNQCFLWETNAGGQVFGTHFEDLFIGMGSFATHAIYSQGAHEWSGLRRVSIGNVNQTGIELGSTGGPFEFTIEDVGITGGSAVSLSTRLGMIINNGSINNIYGLQMYGQSTKNFAKGLRLDFGHVQGGGLHFEFSDVGVSCEQVAVGGHVVSLNGITGTITCTTLVNIPGTFVGTISLTNLVSGGTNVRVANAINGDSITVDLAHYEYTTPGGAVSIIHYLFPSSSATNWVNKGYQAAFNIGAAGRIHAVVHGFDGTTKANALGVSFDGTGYETVLGNADTIGGNIVEKFRLGRLVNTSALPLKGPGYTVATLPAFGTVGTGCRAFVSDALGPAFGAAVVGGGAIFVPVYTDAAGWKVG